MTKIFEENDRYNYGDLTPESVVIDAGGYEGNFANLIHEKYGCEVIVLEPIKAFYERIGQRFLDNPKIVLMPTGLGAKTGATTMRIKGDQTGALCGEGDAELVAMLGVRDLLEIATRNHERPIALLKLNIEGLEFEVLEAMLDEQLMMHVRHLQVQPHPIVPNAQERWDAICRRVDATHEMTFNKDWCWTGWTIR